MNKFAIIAGLSALLFSNGAAVADIIDDNVAKAERGLVNAQKRLDKANQCAADRNVCLKTMLEAAQKSAKRAADKLATVEAAITPDAQ